MSRSGVLLSAACCQCGTCCDSVLGWPDELTITVTDYLEEGTRRYCGGAAGLSAGANVEEIYNTFSTTLTLTRSADLPCVWGNYLPGTIETTDPTGVVSFGSTNVDIGACDYPSGSGTWFTAETRNTTIDEVDVDWADTLDNDAFINIEDNGDGTCRAILYISFRAEDVPYSGTCADFDGTCVPVEDTTSGTSGFLVDAIWHSQSWPTSSPPADPYSLTWTLQDGYIGYGLGGDMCTPSCIGIAASDCAAGGTCISNATWRGCSTTGNWPGSGFSIGKTYCNYAVVSDGTPAVT